MREEIARIQHDIWAHWHRYVESVSTQNPDGSLTIPADKAARWAFLASIPYAGLTEEEQDSDREQADKVTAFLRENPEVQIIPVDHGPDEWEREVLAEMEGEL